MDQISVGKRLAEIGVELVTLGRKRNEIDLRTNALIGELHQLTKSRALAPLQVTETTTASPSSGARLVRNQQPTQASRVLRALGAADTATKYEIAYKTGLTIVQAHYGLISLKRTELANLVGRAQWKLTEKGRAEYEKLPPLAALTEAIEASA